MRDGDLKLDNCIKCSDCNSACPVSRVYPDFPGPKVLGPDTERFRREVVESDTEWVEYCLGCHRCDVTCPHGVNVSELIAKAKARHVKTPRQARRDHWLARPNVLGKFCSSIAPLANAAVKLQPVRWLMSSFGDITSQRSFPPYSAAPLKAAHIVSVSDRRVLFFPGCFIRYNNPALGRTVIELLQLNGFAVEVTPDICCGTPALANGDSAQLMDCLKGNISAMSGAVDSGAIIVTACTSCSYALKADYAHLCAGHSELAGAARRISGNTWDLGELLATELDDRKLNTDFQPVRQRLAYHAPCHLKSQGIGRPWLRVLRAVPGIEIEEIKTDCCGMAGTYGFKSEKYSISMNIGRELFDSILSFQPDAVVTECGSCQMQIQHGTHLRTVHPAEILFAAYQPAQERSNTGQSRDALETTTAR